ncbi:arylsulfatase [Chryseolinea serpens]|uniref:Arylsulfatase n=2 Tax=Chryseolinea serpens TaxID=947013 RepID=A0A1M5XUJ1_9BACT|nr:arylsulfatase [Chryseolinea serpens]
MGRGLSVLLLSGAMTSLHAQHSPTPKHTGKLGKTLTETEQAWPERNPKAPAGAPNVVWILLDDVGFGAISTFGGLIKTPTLDSLANAGLRYTNFHTTAICSPTRAALLTGRNQHSVHMGLFTNTGGGTPGYDGYIPFEKATVAEILRENGYNTYALGKWHLTPNSHATQLGPFNRWPTGRGFDHYFGFLGGATDQYFPVLWEDTKKVVPDGKKLFSTLIADKAIRYIAEQKSIAPEKPFFLYFAPGAGHEPHQVDKYWSDQYKGKFDQGWDKYRETVIENQKRLGVIPQDAALPDRGPGVKPWESLSADEKKLYARFQEVYAGFLSHADYEIGRVIRHLKDLGQLENTLVIISVGDNGASKEGTFEGTASRNYAPDITPEERLKKNLAQIDLIGTAYSRPNYPLGWAQATNTPFKHWKQDANSEGGTHNPLIVFWPNRIKDKGGIRNQYAHLIDILPTTIELTGAKVPTVINGYPQAPIEGTSLAFSIDNPSAPSRHHIQYYEIMGSRSIYKDGWKAGTLHVKKEPFDKDVWELYNLNEDFNERNNLASKYPEKLKELQDLFDAEAWKYNVYPLKDGTVPQKSLGAFDNRDRLVLYPGTLQLFEGTAPPIGGRSLSITADVNVPAKGAEGVLLSIGGRTNGLSLYVQANQLWFAYNNGDEKVYASSAESIKPGKNLFRVDYNYEGVTGAPTGPTGPGTAVLYINDKKVGEVKVKRTLGGGIGTYESIEVGQDVITAVTDKYNVPYAYTGNINNVTIDLK